MGLKKLLPRAFRMAYCYIKCDRISTDDQMSRDQKLKAIHRMEESWLGDLARMFKGNGMIDAALAIGMKDMERIYTSLNSPDDALRFAEVVLRHFPRILIERPEDKTMFQSYILAIYYKGKAYAQKGMVKECEKEFDTVNIKLNDAIEEDPSNPKLQDLYRYMTQEIFYNYIDIADTYPELKQTAYRTCYDQLKTFDQRDPGNEQIQDYIGRFK